MPDASTHWRLTGKIESPTGMTPVAGLLVPKLTRTVIDPDTGKTVLHVEPVTNGGVPFLNGTVDLWLPKGQQIALTVIVERGPRLYKLLAPRSVDGTVAEVVGTWDTDPGVLLTGGAVVSQVELSAAMERIDSTELAARTAVTNAQQASALATSAATQAREAAVLAVAPADTAVASLMGAASQTQAAGDERWTKRGDLIVNVRDYGAIGDGVTNDTAAVQRALDQCAATRKVAFFPAGTYRVTTISAQGDIAGIDCEGVISGSGASPKAVLLVGTSTEGVDGARFRLKMDMSAGDAQAVQVSNATSCTFHDCRIYGFTNHAANHYAFRVEGVTGKNTWTNNHITLFASPRMRGFGIAIYGAIGSGLPWGGAFDGVVSRAEFPSTGNVISGNTVTGGSYAVSLQSVEFSTVVGNYFQNQNHRTVYIANASYENSISGNVFQEYLSSAVLIGYGSTGNVVTGNTCSTGIAGGEAAININMGACNNLIEANRIRSATNYGVYIGPDCIDTTVNGNDISGQYLAAIAVENDWKNPRPMNAIASRPNYEAPPAPYSAWSRRNLTGVVISGNTIRAGYAGRNTAGIYVAQIASAGNTVTKDITVSNNIVASPDQIGYNVYLYEETTAGLTGITLSENSLHAGNANISASTVNTAQPWLGKLTRWGGNGALDAAIMSETLKFTNGDTTPSVAHTGPCTAVRQFECAQTAPTAITMFDDGHVGQEVTIRLDAFTTIKHGSSYIRTRSAADIVGTSQNQLVGLRLVSGRVWLETWRNF